MLAKILLNQVKAVAAEDKIYVVIHENNLSANTEKTGPMVIETVVDDCIY